MYKVEISKLKHKLVDFKESLLEELNRLTEQRTISFEERSEKWQQSIKGEQFLDESEELESIIDEIGTCLEDIDDNLDQIIKL